MVKWLRANQQVTLPWLFGGTVFLEDKEARDSRSGTHGWEKYDSGDYFVYEKPFGKDRRVLFSIYVPKATTSTCKKVQVGVEHVEAQEAHDKPILQWVCDPMAAVNTVAEAEEV
jgi:hypothetical protein